MKVGGKVLFGVFIFKSFLNITHCHWLCCIGLFIFFYCLFFDISSLVCCRGPTSPPWSPTLLSPKHRWCGALEHTQPTIDTILMSFRFGTNILHYGIFQPFSTFRILECVQLGCSCEKSYCGLQKKLLWVLRYEKGKSSLVKQLWFMTSGSYILCILTCHVYISI